MSKISIFKEFMIYLSKNKKWWLTPIVLLFILLALLIVFTESSAVAPFIYALF